jgi:NADP+-dependent farnesol dehydrogenase
MADKWTGKIAVVTGSSSGIGAAVYREFLSHGIITIGLDIDVDKTRAIIAELGTASGHAFKCDISDQNSTEEVFREIESKFRVVHILVNNAGIGR